MIHVAYNTSPEASSHVVEFHYTEPVDGGCRYWSSPLYAVPFNYEEEAHISKSLPLTLLANRFWIAILMNR